MQRLRHVATFEGFTERGASERTFSPDDRLLLTVIEPGTVVAWDVDTGRRMLTLPCGEATVGSARFSADGRRILTITRGRIAVWHSETGALVSEFKDRGESFLSADISPDGNSVATGRSHGLVEVWDAETGKRELSIPLWRYAGPGVLFSPDGRHFAIDSHQEPWICDARTGRVVLDLGLCRHPAFSNDGKRVSAAHTFGIKVWDVANAKIIREFKEEGDEMVFQTRFLPDGERIVSLDHMTRAVNLLDIRTGRRAFSLRSPTALSREVACLADYYVAHPSPDGRLILTSGSTDTVARLWDAETGREVAAITAPAPWLAFFSPDGRRIAAMSIVNREGAAQPVTTVWELEYSAAPE